MRKLSILLALLAGAACTPQAAAPTSSQAPTSAGPVGEAAAAIQRSDFATAISLLKAPVERGDAIAQTLLASL
jgi:hypothetical protein